MFSYLRTIQHVTWKLFSSASIDTFCMCYVQGGGKGVLMTIDGIPIDISEWKCKTVSGVKVNDDAAYPGWYSTDDVYRDWPEAVVS